MSGTSPVGTYQLTYSSGGSVQTATAYKTSIDANFSVAMRVVDNFAPRPAATPNMTVILDAGHLFNGTTLTEVASQTTPTFTAPVGNPRIDRIVVDSSSGTLTVVAGTPASSPTPPAIPANKAPVAQVYLTVGMVAIGNTSITDERDLGALGLSTGAYTTVGTAATLNVGTAANNIPQLNGSAQLPALDGSLLTGAPSAIEFVIDGAGSALATGVKGYIEVPFNCTIKQWTLLADQSGSVTIDIWRTPYLSFDAGTTHPVVADSIVASDIPAIASATKAQDATLVGWTTSLSKGDILAFNVKVAATNITRCTLSLQTVRA